MSVAIMQPYFLPYIGYFQLAAAVDKFVMYDNIEYVKKGRINRKRFLRNGNAEYFSVPLNKGSDYLHVNQRKISPTFDCRKMIAQMAGAYSKAPYYHDIIPTFKEIISFQSNDLFEYLHHSLQKLFLLLHIDVPIIVSSEVDIDHAIKGQEKLISICQNLQSASYLNSIGGIPIYKTDDFKSAGIALQFLKSNAFLYPQFDNPFVPNLSIIDVLMFNDLELVRNKISNGYIKINGN